VDDGSRICLLLLHVVCPLKKRKTKGQVKDGATTFSMNNIPTVHTHTQMQTYAFFAYCIWLERKRVYLLHPLEAAKKITLSHQHLYNNSSNSKSSTGIRLGIIMQLVIGIRFWSRSLTTYRDRIHRLMRSIEKSSLSSFVVQKH
jgi:hypothetical protein